MLKALRISSLAAVILAACGVIVILILGFRGDPDAKAFLQQPGVTENYKGKPTQGDKKVDEVHPLVAQAKKIALRLNPPEPPKPKVDPKVAAAQTAAALKREVVPPKPVVPTPKFELLATVRYASDPKRSLALLKSGMTTEWFRQGEKAGHLTIDEVRDGSAVFSQDGRNQQTLFVPVKAEGKSLLKNDKTAVAAARAQAQPSTPAGVISSPADFRAQAAQAQASTSQDIQEQPVSRIQRIRAEVPQPTIDEQSASLDSTIAGIQEFMTSSDETLSEEERKAEQETWSELLKVLQSEKENLKAAAEQDSAAPAPAPAPQEQPVTEGRRPAAMPAEAPAPQAPPAEPRAEPDPAEQAAAQPEPPVEDEGQGQPAPVEADPPAEPEADPPVAAEADPGVQPDAAPPAEAPPNEY